MKRRHAMIMILAVLLVPLAAHAAANTYQLKVEGLACPFCAYGVEKQLSRLDGVKQVKVDIGSGQVTVTMAEGATLTEAAAHKAVKDAGFTLKAFKQ